MHRVIICLFCTVHSVQRSQDDRSSHIFSKIHPPFIFI